MNEVNVNYTNDMWRERKNIPGYLIIDGYRYKTIKNESPYLFVFRIELHKALFTLAGFTGMVYQFVFANSFPTAVWTNYIGVLTILSVLLKRLIKPQVSNRANLSS